VPVVRVLYIYTMIEHLVVSSNPQFLSVRKCSDDKHKGPSLVGVAETAELRPDAMH